MAVFVVPPMAWVALARTAPALMVRPPVKVLAAESCNTPNMLKLTALLFERDPRPEYADYFERALYNHLLATVAPDSGAVTYFTPLLGGFRTYLDGTHCCVGTGIENTPRYNEGIYFQKENSLWVNLYIPSELDWQEAGMVVRQENDGIRRYTHIGTGKATVEKVASNRRVPGPDGKVRGVRYTACTDADLRAAFNLGERQTLLRQEAAHLLQLIQKEVLLFSEIRL